MSKYIVCILIFVARNQETLLSKVCVSHESLTLYLTLYLIFKTEWMRWMGSLGMNECWGLGLYLVVILGYSPS